jgi:predicted amidohydrolase
MTVACVQQRMRLYTTLDEYRADVRRFLRVAQTKKAHLVVFPELAGNMVAPPLLRNVRAQLLIQADRGRRKEASLWQRALGGLARQSALWLRADLRHSLRGLLDVAGDDLWTRYASLFSDLAREFSVVLVAPSAYLPDPADQVVRNLTAVFGTDGALLGTQAKVILHPEDEGLAQPGATWQPIATPVGALGLMIGGDVLYPEVGRVLAYQGAEILVTLGGCAAPVLYQKVRSGILARMQDNQLFGVASFLVGPNDLGPQREPYVGKSAIFAPQELTPRYNGVLVEMGSPRSEGVLCAEWDFVALKRLWETSDTPIRRQLPLAQAGQLLAKLYERLQELPRTFDPVALPEPADAPPSALLTTSLAPLRLDDLPVINTVTRRWSGTTRLSQRPAETPIDLSELPEQLVPAAEMGSKSTKVAIYGRISPGPDDETDEMDALPQHPEEHKR